ncbi:ATP-dependent DNA helicase chl1 [Basidiobolus ranarum]|uniref:ATP-dependent DNA helicase CHL1 n=1 Tax=Basidiobolus ranarum TaxID=34480 RepID=A0ABR2W0E6_9FUNG
MVSSESEQTQVFALEVPDNASSYRFPFEPYPIQLEFMKNLFKTIEEQKIGIFESPTGTGKSLSLICGALTWLQENQQRHIKGTTTVDTSNSEDPPWVQAFAAERIKKEAEEEETKKRQEHEERVRRVQERDEKERKNKVKKRPRTYSRENEQTTKKSATKIIEEVDDEEQYILEEYDSDKESSGSAQTAGFENYSTEVLDLMKSLEEKEKGLAGVTHTTQQDEDPDEIKIIYCSRTHSQLSQFIHELKKTLFREEVKSVSLGSRKITCIYEPVQTLKNADRMNDLCLELQKPETKAEKKCPYLHKSDPVPMLDYKDRVLAAVQDIEELVSVGRRIGVCPYYGTRKAINPSQIVTMPYNVLLQKSSRDAMGISLKNNILIIDEAHNLIDTITSVNSCTIGLSEVVNANQQLHLYLGKYRNRLKGKNQVYIRQILVLLGALIKNLNRHLHIRESMVTRVADDNEVVMKPVNEFLHQLQIDHLNIFKIQKYMKESQISKKLNGFTENNLRKALLDEANGKDSKPTSGLHKVEAFLMSLTNANANGRVMAGISTTNDQICTAKQPYLRYLLLNPSEQFKDIVSEARSVILAGGTMEPVSDFVDFLFPYLPSEKINQYSFGHIIPPESLLVLSIGESPTSYPLEFTFDKRSDNRMIDELGQVIANMCNIIPDGVVCFFPSYSFLDSVYRRWDSIGVLSRIQKKKKLFQEPKLADMVDQTLREYAHHIENPQGNLTGAVLFSVVGGKMSEGINFSDRLGRGIIMVGLPFANLASPELTEKIKFIESNDSSEKNTDTGKGKAYYENLCMRAVNQSIGRAIRHKDDYAVILLVDRRFSTERIQQKLPTWIGKSLVNCPKFGMNIGKVANFFRTLRAKETMIQE